VVSHPTKGKKRCTVVCVLNIWFIPIKTKYWQCVIIFLIVNN
jgi:hypothetical protein